MIAEQKRSLTWFVLICVAIFVYLLGLGIYSTRGMTPRPIFDFLLRAIFICGVVWWLRADPQGSPATRVYCSGLLVSLAWPIIIPYHLLKTRGVTGLIYLLVLFATIVIGAILAVVISLAYSGLD